GQVVVHQVLQAGDGQQLRRGDGAVAPEAAGAAYAYRAAHACASMRSSSAPLLAWPPAATQSSATRPSNGATSVCSIFIASSTARRWPACTRSPAATATSTTRPV